MKEISKNLGDNSRIAKILIDICETNKINTIAFTGELGSGKTTLIQEIGKQLGILSLIPSPSFVLMNEYKIPNHPNFKTLTHCDFYRIKDSEELYVLDLEQKFGNKKNIVVIEWAEKFANILPKSYLQVSIEISPKNILHRLYLIEIAKH